jgi:hypothetical protein
MALNYPLFYIPKVITAGYYIDFVQIGGVYISAPITQGAYLTPWALMDQVVIDMTAAGGVESYVYSIEPTTMKVTVTSTGKFDIINHTTTQSFDIGIYIGFDPDHTEDTSASEIIASWQIQDVWNPNVPPSEDGYLRRQKRTSIEMSMAGYHRHIHHDQISTRRLSFIHIPRYKMFYDEEGSYTNESLQRIIDRMPSRVIYIPDRTTETTYRDCYMTNNLDKYNVEKYDQSGLYWSIDISLNDLT